MLCSCAKPVVGILSDISVAPSRLDFIGTPLGDSSARPLTVQNGSRAPVQLRLTAPPPFALELEMELGGGESKAVHITFSPTGLGLAQGALQLRGEGQELEVLLEGQGVERVECATPRACRRSFRDALTNTCVESTAEDGTECTPEGNVCIV